MCFNSLAFVASELMLTASLAVAQVTKSLTGTASDAMCGAHHMVQGKNAAKCARECVKQGSDFAFVNGGKLYTMKRNKIQFDKFAGENVAEKGRYSARQSRWIRFVRLSPRCQGSVIVVKTMAGEMHRDVHHH